MTYIKAPHKDKPINLNMEDFLGKDNSDLPTDESQSLKIIDDIGIKHGNIMRML
jgi:hypothetical protein